MRKLSHSRLDRDCSAGPRRGRATRRTSTPWMAAPSRAARARRPSRCRSLSASTSASTATIRPCVARRSRPTRSGPKGSSPIRRLREACTFSQANRDGSIVPSARRPRSAAAWFRNVVGRRATSLAVKLFCNLKLGLYNISGAGQERRHGHPPGRRPAGAAALEPDRQDDQLPDSDSRRHQGEVREDEDRRTARLGAALHGAARAAASRPGSTRRSATRVSKIVKKTARRRSRARTGRSATTRRSAARAVSAPSRRRSSMSRATRSRPRRTRSASGLAPSQFEVP